MAVPWLTFSVSGHTRRRIGFSPRSVHLGIVVNKVALWQGFLPVSRAFALSIVPPVAHSYSFTHRQRVNTNNQHCQPIHASVAIGCRVQLKWDGTRCRTGEEVKGKLANGVGSQYSSHYLGKWCIQHYYRWWAHLGCQQSTELTPLPI